MAKKDDTNKEIMEKLNEIEDQLIRQHGFILSKLENRLSETGLMAWGFFGITIAAAATFMFITNKDPIVGFIAVMGLAVVSIAAILLILRVRRGDV